MRASRMSWRNWDGNSPEDAIGVDPIDRFASLLGSRRAEGSLGCDATSFPIGVRLLAVPLRAAARAPRLANVVAMVLSQYMLLKAEDASCSRGLAGYIRSYFPLAFAFCRIFSEFG